MAHGYQRPFSLHLLEALLGGRKSPQLLFVLTGDGRNVDMIDYITYEVSQMFYLEKPEGLLGHAPGS